MTVTTSVVRECRLHALVAVIGITGLFLIGVSAEDG
jgi:hypothetical protein